MNAHERSRQRRASSGPIKLTRVGRRTLDSVTVDRFIPYFDLTIGVLLISWSLYPLCGLGWSVVLRFGSALTVVSGTRCWSHNLSSGGNVRFARDRWRWCRAIRGLGFLYQR